MLGGLNSQPGHIREAAPIVYLSRTHNTQAVAEIIHKYMGGTLVSLELAKPYPENYQQTVQQVVRENEAGYLPPVKNKGRQYRTIRRHIRRIPDLGYADAAAYEKFSPPI